MTVTIIGGGISGLTTAFYTKRLQPDCEVVLLEKAPFPGGTMHTESIDGFLFETGSNGFLSNKPDTLDLVRDSGGDSLLMRSGDASRIRYIFTDRLHRLPETPGTFIKTPLLSWRGKLRTAAEIVVPPQRGGEDETLQEFGYRRLGKEFTDTFLNAMSAGIYASSPESISVNAAFPAVVKLEQEYGGLFKGMIKKRKRGAGPGGVLMSFRGGVGTFVEHLSRTLPITIRTSTEATTLERADGGYRITIGEESLMTNKVVLATPAYASARIINSIAPDISLRLRDIEYSPISVVGFGYDTLKHELNGFGLLTTASSDKKILGVLWDSSIFSDRAPEGKKSLRVMIGGQRNPDLARLNDTDLIDVARQGVKETMGIEEQPTVTFVRRWEKGIPNYRVGHLANVDSIFEQLRAYPGLYLNSNAYYGIGINDCVANSRKCAERVVKEQLTTNI
ncbi:MAG: protoporphyrinogen oxidase [Gammaproteobacteria bacterium]|nr:protoporphyrinogen oxidase [Gammaproteobacteria bacterium]